jgi:hypothetical protein
MQMCSSSWVLFGWLAGWLAGCDDTCPPGGFLPPLQTPAPAPLQVKVAIIREEGSNGDREMSAAVYAAGMQPWDVTMSDLLAGRVTLDDFRGIVFVSPRPPRALPPPRCALPHAAPGPCLPALPCPAQLLPSWHLRKLRGLC